MYVELLAVTNVYPVGTIYAQNKKMQSLQDYG